ncbi:MAG: nucleotidyltransferase domain-containing protein [Candidatus Moraniibacteriota bacterium]
MEKNLESIKIDLIPLLRSNDASQSFVFGSYARNDAHEGSDLDLLLSFRTRKSLLDLVALQLKLEEKLGMKVDIVTEESLHPRLRPLVDREKIRVL